MPITYAVFQLLGREKVGNAIRILSDNFMTMKDFKTTSNGLAREKSALTGPKPAEDIALVARRSQIKARKHDGHLKRR